MPVFSSADFDDHEQVVFARDPCSGLRAIIAIHNTKRGPALGGCRMWPYANEDEALTDALRLARGMTYKAAMLGLDFGGGKAVLMGDPGKDKSDALLRAFGRLVHSLGGRYHTAEDVGMTVADMDIVRLETPFAHGLADGTGEPSAATAFGVFVGIEAAVEHRLGLERLKGLRVAVQGLGSVGYRLCRYLAEEGVRLLVADVDAEKVARVRAEFGATPVDPAAIHATPVDVFSPCALGAVVNDRTIAEIKARIIAGAANNQLAEPRHGAALMARGILYAPDYVINAGGLIDVANEGPDYDPNKALDQVECIRERLGEIFRRAARDGLATDRVADAMAEENFRTPERSATPFAA